MAHNHDRDFVPYYRMPVGQLLLIDENIFGYIKLTSPFGDGSGSDGKSLPSSNPTRGRDVSSLADFRNTRMGDNLLRSGNVFIQETTPDRLPAHLKHYLQDLKDEEQRNAGK